MEPVSTVLTISELYNNRKNIANSIRSIRRILKAGTFNIAVFGNAGSGKSTLGKLLAGDNIPLSYEESQITERYTFANGPLGVMDIVPGQQDKLLAALPSIQPKIMNGSIKLLINVVTGGYPASVNLDITNHPDYRQDMANAEFMQIYQEKSMQEDVNRLKDMLPYFQLPKGKLNMITLVTKQDLWWDHAKEIQNFYEKGEYFELITELINKIGANNFTHKFAYTSLIRLNLHDTAKEILAPTCAGYDEFRYSESQAEMIRILYQTTKSK